MDIIRDTRPQRRRKRILLGVGALVALVALTVAVRSLPTAVPSVDRATVWTDTVQRGQLVRMVRGAGTLVPEQARWITSVTAGRIERILLLPGADVGPGEVIMELSNPDVQMELLDAQTQLSGARSTLAQLQASLETQKLTQRAAVAATRTQYLEAKRVYETNQALFDANPDNVARDELDRSREAMEEFRTRLELDESSVEVLERSSGEQIAAQEDQIRRLEAQVEFNQRRLESLRVTTPVPGLLAPLQTALQEGQWVQSGENLGRVVVPGRLKAEVRIPQTQAQEIVEGQRALVDTRTDTIEGTVSRIDPAVRSGSVTIDVRLLPDTLPPSARPDLSVDGNVIIESLDDVVYMGRPNFGQADQRVSLFKLVEDGSYAERVLVQLGASSVNEIEVREGLQPGDVVILSDMSQWDGFDRVRLR
jgi:multidrug resistance efflux pump